MIKNVRTRHINLPKLMNAIKYYKKKIFSKGANRWNQFCDRLSWTTTKYKTK